MEVWDHDGKLYEVNSYYSLPDVAWQYELIGLTGAPGTGPYLAIVIPDATPDEGPFSPKHVGHALVRIGGGVAPWPILLRLIELAESGDIVDTDQAHVTADDEIVEVQIPDGNPNGGSFIPVPADRVTFTVHGEWNIPWLVFRRFIEVIAASGDIVQGRRPSG